MQLSSNYHDANTIFKTVICYSIHFQLHCKGKGERKSTTCMFFKWEQLQCQLNRQSKLIHTFNANTTTCSTNKLLVDY